MVSRSSRAEPSAKFCGGLATPACMRCSASLDSSSRFVSGLGPTELPRQPAGNQYTNLNVGPPQNFAEVQAPRSDRVTSTTSWSTKKDAGVLLASVRQSYLDNSLVFRNRRKILRRFKRLGPTESPRQPISAGEFKDPLRAALCSLFGNSPCLSGSAAQASFERA